MLFLFSSLGTASNFAVDLGSQFAKAAFTNQNALPEIGLNYQTKRQTPFQVAFRGNPDQFRPYFGDAATPILESRPWMGSAFLPYFYDTSETTIFHLNNSVSHLTFEDLNEIFFKLFFDCLSKQTEVSSVLLIVPSTYNYKQRNQLTRMIKSIGYQFSGIIDDADAIANLYAIEKIKNYHQQPQTVLFVDVGATKVAAFAEHFLFLERPRVTRLSYASSRTGGAFITEYLARKYENSSLTKHQLFTAAEKAKTQLLLSKETIVNVEDENLKFTREDLEEPTRKLADEILAVINRATTNSDIKVDSIEIIGGSSRLFGLQQMLNLTLGHSLNAEEATVMGGAYAAQFKSGFSRFQKIDIIDNFSLFDVHINNITICEKGKKCTTDRLQITNETRLTMACDGEPSLDYILPSQNESAVIFSGHPPMIESIEETNTSKKQRFELVNSTGTMNPAVIHILEGERQRVSAGVAKNRLEQAIYRILDELKFKQEFQEFANETQRQELYDQAQNATELLESNSIADFDTRARNLEILESRVLSRSQTYRLAAKLTIDFETEFNRAKKSLDVDWVDTYLSSGNITKKFTRMINETSDWFNKKWKDTFEQASKYDTLSLDLSAANKKLMLIKKEHQRLLLIKPNLWEKTKYYSQKYYNKIMNRIRSQVNLQTGSDL